MLCTRRIIRSGIALVAAAALSAGTVEAQFGSPDATWTGVGPFNLEGYYTHYRLDGNADRVGMNGAGARLMWGVGSSDNPSVRPRSAIGVFAEYAPQQDVGFSMWHAGVQGDVAMLRRPWLGRVSPVLALSAGALSTKLEDGDAAEQTGFPLGTRSTTTFALTPSVGTRVRLWKQLGVRADVSDVMTFRDGTRHNVQFTAGVSLPF